MGHIADGCSNREPAERRRWSRPCRRRGSGRWRWWTRVSDEDLERVHSTLMSPLVWDLGHIAAFEDLWLVHRYGGRPLLRDELADVYDAFETPAPAAAICRSCARARRARVPGRGARAHARGDRTRRASATAAARAGDPPRAAAQRDDAADAPARAPAGLPARAAPACDGPRRHDSPDASLTGLELVEIPGGPCTIGAAAEGFAYDNERPRHRTDVRGYLIGRTPITNATYLTFVEGGGYERREWWSDEGWAWKEEYDITRPAGWTADLGRRVAPGELRAARPAPARRPRLLVRGRRLRPRARRPPPHRSRVGEGGDLGPGAGPSPPATRGVTSRRHPGRPRERRPARARPAPRSAAHPDGRSPYGCLGHDRRRLGVDRAASSTATPASPPTRTASTPRCSSATDYRVLRGGSWATRARVLAADLPQLGLPPAPADLRRPPDREGSMRALMQTATDADRLLAVGGRGALAGQRRARRPHPAVQGAPAQALLRRARLGAVRADLRAARVLPDAHRALDPASARADEIVASTGAGELVELGSGASDKARILLDAMERAGTLDRYVPLDVSETVVRERGRAARRASTTGCRSTAWSATSSATSSACHRRRSGDTAPGRRCWAARSATSRPGTPAPAAQHPPSCSGPTTGCCSAPTWSRIPSVIEAAYDDSPGRHRRVQPQRAARDQPRARRGLRSRRVRARRVLRPPPRVGRDAAARPPAVHSADRRPRAAGRVRRRRGAAHRDQRQVHPAAAGERLRGRRAPPGTWFTDPDGLFALSLAAPA